MSALALLLIAATLHQGETAVPHIKAAFAAYEAGKTAQRDKQFERASQAFLQAIDIEPTFLDAREALITVYLDSGHRLEAAASITEYLQIQAGAVHYRVLLGQILLEQKQTEKALAQFSLALKTDPYNIDGLLGLAFAAQQLGMENRAAEALERGRKHYPLDKRFQTAPVVHRQ